MSERWPGGIISGTAPVPSGSFANSTAPGVWTMEQAAYWQAQGNWPTPGSVNPDAFIENLFSTYLWDGNSTARNIVNGIDLATKGGMVWAKYRNATNSHRLYDTNRGATKQIFSDLNFAEQTATQSLTAFNTDGFSLGTGQPNENTATVVGWTFRKQPKFFDIVTWSGDSTSGRQISHNLGSTPGMVVVKSLATDNWCVWHRGLTSGRYIVLNSTAAQTTAGAVNRFGNGSTTVDPTSTNFTVGSNGEVNQSGNNYVAYLFAHDAGGFGTSGTDNVISCGSFTPNGSGQATVNLGYEPQLILYKNAAASGDWYIYDTMRGWGQTTAMQLVPNTSQAESQNASSPYFFFPTATGFQSTNDWFAASQTHIYMAIRRGPMKVPTTGTSVFSPFTTAASTGTTVTTNFPVDFQLYKYRVGVDYWFDVDRLRGINSTTTANSTPWLDTTATTAEATATNVSRNWGNTSFEVPGIVGGASNVFYSFRRAPGFFDVVCYTGTGSSGYTVAHNLTVIPEIIIIKKRSASGANWNTYVTNQSTSYIPLLLNDAGGSGGYLVSQSNSASSSLLKVGYIANNWDGQSNDSGATYVAYLFATCAGVSKVGSYTGNGGTQAIACGFTGGARFVLIKRTDATGDWYVYDTARGMTTLTDPYLLLNSTAAEVATLGSVTTTTGGFTVDASILAAINTNAASYIFLAIA